jgi:hypothetical protein
MLMKFQISQTNKSVPTFLVFKSNNDTPIRTIVGADKTILEQTIDLIASGHYDSPKKDRGQAGKDRNISEEDSSESNEKKDQRKCAKERKSTWE